MSYIHSLPTSVSFTGKGLQGYTFGPLRQKDLEIYYIEVEKGHDVFMISKKITRVYYVLAGSGYFTIDNQRYDISPGMLVEVPPGVEYCYSGKMTLIGLSRPRWFSRNDTFTRWNPDVFHEPPHALERESWFTRLARAELFGKSPARAWLGRSQSIWDRLPTAITNIAPIRRYGDFLHMVARRQSRAQALATLFLRNRPELELISRLVKGKSQNGTLRVTLLACSAGAEAYSVAWKIRSVRPDLKLIFNAIDISSEAVEFAKAGVYPLAASSELTNTKICEGLSVDEIDELFDRDGNVLTIKPWIGEGIHWRVGDASDAEIVEALGPQDIVVANNFLCHMNPPVAEGCLRNVSRLVTQGGYLFVGGIDLDVRTKVARDLGWEPVQDLLEEIHDGDTYLRRYWPSLYAGLEPLNKGRKDWRTRYAAAFKVGDGAPNPRTVGVEAVSGAVNR